MGGEKKLEELTEDLMLDFESSDELDVQDSDEQGDQESPEDIEQGLEDDSPEDDQVDLSESDDDDSEGDADDDSGSDSENEKEKTLTQSEVDSILTARLASEKLKTERANEQAQAYEKKLKKYEAQLKEVSEAQQEFHDKIKDDEYISDEVKKSYKVSDFTEEEEHQEIRTRVIDDSVIHEYADEAEILQIKMNEEYTPSLAKSIADRAAKYISDGYLPADLVLAANSHENGIKLIKDIVINKNIANELHDSMAVSLLEKNSKSFLLKFNELADNIGGTNKNESNNDQKKKRLKPNKQINAKPSTEMDSDDELMITF